MTVVAIFHWVTISSAALVALAPLLLLVLPDPFGCLMHAFELADFLLLLQEALLVVISFFTYLFELRLDAVNFFLVLDFLALKLV